MKAYLFRLGCGILIAALLAGFSGCGANSDNTAAPAETTVTEAAQTAEAETTTEAEPETTTEAATAMMTARATKNAGDWAAAYQAYLLNAIENYDSIDDLRFGFLYLDGDDVPELWVTDGLGAHGFSYVIVTCRDGKAAEVCDGANYLDYFEKKGVFSFSGSYGATSGGGTFYQMTATGCETLDSYEYEYQTETDILYRVNDAEVSEEEYNALRDKYINQYGVGKTVGETDGFPLTKESIAQNCK